MILLDHWHLDQILILQTTTGKYMSEKHSELPYRDSVGIMLINRQGLVWVGRRLPKWQQDRSNHIWQMPQGGIAEGESKKQAALRELMEEVGTRNVEVLARSCDWLTYDLPEKLLGVALGGRYRGHRYKWFAMRFLGSDDQINISDKDGFKAEFDKWRWVAPKDIPELGLSFRRKVYKQVVREFRPYTVVTTKQKKPQKAL
jgi:putative (di)nucleoside polyphosphate hydrolase